jgi:hypothetical protein
VPDLEAKLAEVTAAGATVKENQTSCLRLVRSSQATPRETA